MEMQYSLNPTCFGFECLSTVVVTVASPIVVDVTSKRIEPLLFISKSPTSMLSFIILPPSLGVSTVDCGEIVERWFLSWESID